VAGKGNCWPNPIELVLRIDAFGFFSASPTRLRRGVWLKAIRCLRILVGLRRSVRIFCEIEAMIR
jgi:hypothetical protein